MTAYYNEKDPYAAEWLRRLMLCSLIPWGDVDERSIEDVTPDDLRSYTQCHFFAGIGVWSLALQRAGWPDDRRVWTGSCPCQPFSAAGKGNGFDDERHLWPHWFHLINQCRPPIVLGEQVASKDGLNWLDLVSSDMEGADYAVGASDLCAAGFGGAHIRQRLYFVGVADDEARGRGKLGGALEPGQIRYPDSRSDAPSRMGDDDDERLSEQRRLAGISREASRTNERESPERASSPVSGLADDDDDDRCSTASSAGLPNQQYHAEPRSNNSGLGDASYQSRERRAGEVYRAEAGVDGAGFAVDGPIYERFSYASEGVASRPYAPMLGRNLADWLFCRDGKWRPVEPGTFPLAHAAPARVGRLRAYGNGLDLETATGFVEAVMECAP